MSQRRAAPPPPAWLTFLETRAVGDLGSFFAASPLLRMVGRGDRHPVLVLPGFTASDRSTEPLRWFLRGQGYWVHGWQLGRNLGPSLRIVTGMEERLRELHDRHGRAVSLVGWSLGGIYARLLARIHPDLVRQVITLGSPFRVAPGDRTAIDRLWNAATGTGSRTEITSELLAEAERQPMPVPATAIYSKGDGVVTWWLCLEETGPTSESIEVRGSHSGLGFNPAVLYAISDRLAQAEGQWRHFEAPRPLRLLFPPSRSWSPTAA